MFLDRIGDALFPCSNRQGFFNYVPLSLLIIILYLLAKNKNKIINTKFRNNNYVIKQIGIHLFGAFSLSKFLYSNIYPSNLFYVKNDNFLSLLMDGGVFHQCTINDISIEHIK